MGKNILVLLVIAGFGLYSCKSESDRTGNESLSSNSILQQQDGTISLQVNKADTYHDASEPGSNTAEWSVVVSKSGRYDVWLSSATKDTTRLNYQSAVMLSIKDDMLEARPSIDKVIQNSTEVSLPYYRADSFIGSLYIKDTGVYNVQVISDMIVPEDKDMNDETLKEETKLISVSLTPSE